MSDDDETPEQRLLRFKEKADRLGPQAWSPKVEPAPVDEDPALEHQIKRAAIKALNLRTATQEERVSNDASLQLARNKADMWALPKAFWMRQHVPGAEYVGKALDKLSAPRDPAPANLDPVDAGEIDDPAPGRKAVQMQREFSSEQEKQEYLTRIREAAKKASGK